MTRLGRDQSPRRGPGLGALGSTRARRMLWGLSDQALSSITNFGLGIMIARTVSPRQFGAFSLAFATYLMFLGITRALTTEPLAVRFARWDPNERKLGTAHASGASLLLGSGFGLLMFVVSWFIPDPTRTVFIATSLCLPLILMQDAWRYIFVSAGVPHRAFLNDLVWAVLLFPSLVILSRLGMDAVGWLIIAWGGTAGLAAFFGFMQARILPRPAAALQWWRSSKGLGTRYVGEFAATTGASYMISYVVVAAAGLAAAGALRGGQLLLGPASVLHLGVNLLAVPELSRIRSSRSSGQLRRASLTLSIGLAVVSATWAIGISNIPAELGTELLGEAWGIAQPLIIPLGLGLAASGFTMGASAGLRALEAASEGLKTRLVVSSVTLACGGLGAVLGGALGAAWGSSAALWGGSLLWWRKYLLMTHREPSPTPPDDVDSSVDRRAAVSPDP